MNDNEQWYPQFISDHDNVDEDDYLCGSVDVNRFIPAKQMRKLQRDDADIALVI